MVKNALEMQQVYKSYKKTRYSKMSISLFHKGLYVV